MITTAMVEVTVSLELSVLILAALIVFAIGIVLLINWIKSKNSITVDGMDVGLGEVCFHICTDETDRQVAYKIWIEICTRTIGVAIDLDVDNIRAIHKSFYEFFGIVRSLIKELPPKKLNKSKELIALTIDFLNKVMRPYLTKWGIQFNDWYDKQNISASQTPIQIQKKYNQYNELSKDLLCINKKVITYSKQLELIAFKKSNSKLNS